MDFSPLSVLWMMICWLSLISGGGGKVLLPPGFLLMGRSWLWGDPNSLHLEKGNGWRGIAALHFASAVLHGGKTPSIHPSKSQKGRPLPNPIWRCCRAGNWPLIREAEISLFRRALFQPMEFHGRWTGKTCQKNFYSVGKCSKLYQKLISTCQNLSAQCQRVAILTSLMFLGLHCISWQVK